MGAYFNSHRLYVNNYISAVACNCTNLFNCSCLKSLKLLQHFQISESFLFTGCNTVCKESKFPERMEIYLCILGH